MKLRILITVLIVMLAGTAGLRAVSDTTETLPVFAIHALPTKPVCNDTSIDAGTTATLRVLAPVNASFRWYDSETGGTLLNTGNVFTTPALNAETTYYVESEDNTTKCRSARIAVKVSIGAPGGLKVVLINSSESICSGSSVQIGLKSAMTDGTAPYKYSWQPATDLSSSTDSVVTASPDETTKYTLTVTDANDTKGSANVNVIVYPQPDPQIAGNKNIQVGTSVTYSVITPAGTNNKWSVENGTELGSSSGDTYQVRWDNLGTGKIIVEQTLASFDCKASDTIIVTISQDVPQLVVNAGIDKGVCRGGSVQIGDVNAASGGTPPYTYQWNPSNGLSDHKIPNPIAQPNQTTTYRLSVTDSQNSTVEDDVTVTIYPFPGKPEIVSPDAKFENNSFYICNSASITLMSKDVYDGYLWLKDGNKTGVTSRQLETIETGVYTLIVNTQYGCADTSQVNVAKYTPQITLKFDDVKENPANHKGKTHKIHLKKVSYSDELLGACKPDSLYMTVLIHKSIFFPKGRQFKDSANWIIIIVADRIDLSNEDLLDIEGSIILGDTNFSEIIIRDISWGRYGKLGIKTFPVKSKFELTGLSETGGLRLLKFSKPFSLMQIKPNPASDEIEMVINCTENNKVEVNIYNTLGQIVQSAKIELLTGINTKKIELPKEIPSGIYRISVGNMNGFDTKSIIIGK
ncbi:MAG: T9SS type A sorting domain-containing protein [Bacteroidota bacterium]